MGWELEYKVAILRSDDFVASFDREEPHAGLLLKNDSLPASQLFSFLVSEDAQETYVRGTDLISKYPARSSDLVSYQTYFRTLSAHPGIEFILSAQTSLLESAPMTKVVSHFPSCEVLAQIDGECQTIEASDFAALEANYWFLLRHADAPASWLIFVHPSDFYHVTVDRRDARTRIQFSVFPESLEKGVIRRASFQWRVLPRQTDVEQAVACVTSAEQAAPPLTT